jgi:hypothetical protein
MSSYYFTDPAEIRRLLADPEWQRQQAEHKQQIAEAALSSDYRRSLHNALISSEIRHIGARLMDFCQKLEPFLHNELQAEQRVALVDLYTRFSAEIGLLQAAAHQLEGAGEIIDPFADVLRTPLEEGILAYSREPSNSYRDPHKVKSNLLSGYRSALSSHAWVLKGLSPTSSRNDFSFDVRIEEYGYHDQPLSQKRCEELLGTNNSRVIDPTRPEPQEGFGRKLTSDEFMGFVECASTLFSVPCDNQGALGYYLLDTDRDNIPCAAREAIEADRRWGQINEQDGWVINIALATTARDRLRGPCDELFIAHEYKVGAELNPAHALGEIALRPSDASDVGPGDYIRDTDGTLHRIQSNTAFGLSHPSSCSITTTEGRMFGDKDIELYLKTQSLFSYRRTHSDSRPPTTVQLTHALSPTGVTDVGPGDFISDRQGVIREITSNSAAGAINPRSWQVKTVDEQSFGMFDVSAYLKRSQVTEEFIQAHKPPSLYRWLTRTACETACNKGIATLWCQVRVGNTAREKHLAVGWESTGITYRSGEIEFEILRLDPHKIVTDLTERDLARLRQEHVDHKADYARLRSLAKDAWTSTRGALEDQHFLDIFSERFSGCSIKHDTDSLARLRVTVTPQAKAPLYFQQGLPGYDLWRAQRDTCYSLSLYNPLASLEQTIAAGFE